MKLHNTYSWISEDCQVAKVEIWIEDRIKIRQVYGGFKLLEKVRRNERSIKLFFRFKLIFRVNFPWKGSEIIFVTT